MWKKYIDLTFLLFSSESVFSFFQYVPFVGYKGQGDPPFLLPAWVWGVEGRDWRLKELEGQVLQRSVI